MNFLAHVTSNEAPVVLLALVAGLVLGLAAAVVIRFRRPSERG